MSSSEDAQETNSSCGEEEEDATPPVGQGVKRKQRDGDGDGGKKKKVANDASTGSKFDLDDAQDVEIFVQGARQTMKGVDNCAEATLQVLSGQEHKEKRNAALKKFHQASMNITESRLKMDRVPGVVQGLFKDQNMEEVAEDLEVDDTEFLSRLDGFEKQAEKAVKEEWSSVTSKDVDVDDEYQESLEKLNAFHPRKKGVFARSSGTNAKADSSSQGIEALTDFIPTRDPVTRKPFKDPYVNTICGHVYDFDTVHQLSMTAKFRCPYGGCTNTKPIKSSDLVKDAALEKKIKEKILQEKGKN